MKAKIGTINTVFQKVMAAQENELETMLLQSAKEGDIKAVISTSSEKHFAKCPQQGCFEECMKERARVVNESGEVVVLIFLYWVRALYRGRYDAIFYLIIPFLFFISLPKELCVFFINISFDKKLCEVGKCVRD